ncbi:MAG: LysR family transcriptional regulator [Acidimicrobiales bacterium]|nr:MAG: LysR family transcriptional regulator [Acidimicrobiales bacterium]
MTPAQLRTFAAVARHGSSRAAAAELGVSEAAVSGHVAALRKELGDELFRRSGAGLGFTPGGLRLASRAVELLGLQDQTRREVRAAADGQRILRIAVSSLFGEYSAPGLIELFSTRADDLEVEMSVCAPVDFHRLLAARAIDVAIGPSARQQREGIATKEFLRYQLVAVVGVEHAVATTNSRDLPSHLWLLGPSAVDPSSSASLMLQRLGVTEQHQRIFQNHAVALAEARAGHGIALCPMHMLATELGDGRLVQVRGPGSMIDGVYVTHVLRQEVANPLASELVRFISTPRAIQAMLTGSGANVSRFRPRVHVTLWS